MTYRVRETRGSFYAEGRFENIQRFWGKKNPVHTTWKTLDMFGRVWAIYSHGVPIPPVAEFDTIEEARKFIKMLEKGTVYHEA